MSRNMCRRSADISRSVFTKERKSAYEKLSHCLNSSEQARKKIAPILTNSLTGDIHTGEKIEQLFSNFWELARKADNMVDYCYSTDRRWMYILQNVFLLCSDITTNEINREKRNGKACIPLEKWHQITGYFFRLMSRTCAGEIKDLLSNKQIPSESNYDNMVKLKTAPWFTGRIACVLLASKDSSRSSENLKDDLIRYGDLVSLAYQIRNDIDDVILNNNRDIQLGKLNHPMLMLAIQNPWSLQYSASKRRDLCIEEGFIEYSQRKAQMFQNRANRMIEKYPFLNELDNLTSDLCKC